jgi:hypothetical protein
MLPYFAEFLMKCNISKFRISNIATMLRRIFGPKK